MRERQRELREQDFSGRRIVRSLSNSTSSSTNAPFGAAVTCLAEMTSDSVNWLWGDVLALGKVTLLTGASGVGKSFVALQMAAAVTLGERDSRAETRGEPGQVLLVAPEVELRDVVRPRLQAAGAELSRVHALRGIRRSSTQADDDQCRAFQLDEDLRLLEHEIAERKAAEKPLRLIVIDPFPVELFAYRYGTADLVRTMRELAEIAAWSQVAILLVVDNSIGLSGSWGNLIKVLHSTAQSVWSVFDGRDEGTALNPIRSSARFRDQRSGWSLPNMRAGCADVGCKESDPSSDRELRDDEPEPEPDRLLLSVKANLKQKSTGLSFRLVEGCVEWHPEPVDMTAEQYSAQQDDRARSSALLLEQEWSELARATHWLKRRLTRGVTPLRELRRAADEHDISFSTLRRAFCGLKGVAQRIGGSRLWGWSLPEHDTRSGRLPTWLNVEDDENDEESDEAPASVPSDFEQPVPPETNERARDELQCRAQEPDEVVELPDGTITWKSLLDPSELASLKKVEPLVATETRRPDS